MSRWRVAFDIQVDDEALAEHDGDAKPPPPIVTEWYDSDVFSAMSEGIIEVDHAELYSVERLEDGADA